MTERNAEMPRGRQVALLVGYLLAATAGTQIGRLGLVLGGSLLVGGIALAISSAARRRAGFMLAIAGLVLAVSGQIDVIDEAAKKERRGAALRARVQELEVRKQRRDDAMSRLVQIREQALDAMRGKRFDEAVLLYRQTIHPEGLPEDEARAAQRDYRNANVAAGHPEWTARAVEAVLRASTDDELHTFLQKGWLPPRAHRDNPDVQAALRRALLPAVRQRLDVAPSANPATSVSATAAGQPQRAAGQGDAR